MTHDVVLQQDSLYTLTLDGNADGLNSTSPMYSIVDTAWRTTYQPNIETRIENVGLTPIDNPHLAVNGRVRWWNADTVVSVAAAGLSSESDRVRAVYELLSKNRFWSEPVDLWGNSLSDAADPVRVLNVYGFNHCGGAMNAMVQLALALGLGARQVNIEAHTVAEVRYGGSWHQFDADGAGLFLLTDNVTVASVDEIIANPSLVYQTPVFGIDGERLLGRSQREISQMQVARFNSPWYNFEGVYHRERLKTMDFRLYPEESIRFGYIRATTKRPAISTAVEIPDAAIGNGRFTYHPKISSSSLWKNRTGTLINLESETVDLKRPSIHTTMPAVWGKMTLPFVLPYRILDGILFLRTVRNSPSDSIRVTMLVEGKRMVDFSLSVRIGKTCKLSVWVKNSISADILHTTSRSKSAFWHPIKKAA